MNINKVSRVKCWGRSSIPLPPVPTPMYGAAQWTLPLSLLCHDHPWLQESIFSSLIFCVVSYPQNMTPWPLELSTPLPPKTSTALVLFSSPFFLIQSLVEMPLPPSSAILMIQKHCSERQNRPSSSKTTDSGSRLLLNISQSNLLSTSAAWLRVWETAQDKGPYWTRISITQSFKVLIFPLFRERCCPNCSTTIPSDISHCEHLVDYHCPSWTCERLNKLLSELDSEFELTLQSFQLVN